MVNVLFEKINEFSEILIINWVSERDDDIREMVGLSQQLIFLVKYANNFSKISFSQAR